MDSFYKLCFETITMIQLMSSSPPGPRIGHSSCILRGLSNGPCFECIYIYMYMFGSKYKLCLFLWQVSRDTVPLHTTFQNLTPQAGCSLVMCSHYRGVLPTKDPRNLCFIMFHGGHGPFDGFRTVLFPLKELGSCNFWRIAASENLVACFESIDQTRRTLV